MDKLVEAIASNAALQAVAIIITLVTALLFIIKNIPPFVRFCARLVRNGRERAIAATALVALRLARRDYRDARLISVTIAYFFLEMLRRAIVATFFIIIARIAVGSVDVNFAPREITEPKILALIAITKMFGAVTSIAVAWYLSSVLFQFMYYQSRVRQLILRANRRASS